MPVGGAEAAAGAWGAFAWRWRMGVDCAAMGEGRTTVTAQQLRATAELARLLFSDSDDELEQLRGELSAILDHAAQLAEVDVTGVPPMTHVVELACPLRADVVGQHDSLAAALGNAPASEGAFFVVPAVFAGPAVATAAADGADDPGAG